jgi:hypothetical protein
MRIEVLAEEDISPQARTYAEYRVFAALSQFVGADQVRDASVVLGAAHGRYGDEGIACTVTVNLDPGGVRRIRTIGDHAYAAINRAVDCLRESDRVVTHGRA